MRKFAFILLLTAAGLLAGCRHDDVSEAFSLDGTVRIECDGAIVFQYNPVTCQQFFNRDSGTFRVGTDTMSDYFSVTLAEIPSSHGDVVRGDIRWTTDSGMSDIRNVTLKVMKLEGDTVWLWSRSAKIGLTLKLLY